MCFILINGYKIKTNCSRSIKKFLALKQKKKWKKKIKNSFCPLDVVIKLIKILCIKIKKIYYKIFNKIKNVIVLLALILQILVINNSSILRFHSILKFFKKKNKYFFFVLFNLNFNYKIKYFFFVLLNFDYKIIFFYFI